MGHTCAACRIVFAIASAAVLLSLNFAVYSAAGVEPVQRMAQMLAPHVDAETPIGTYKVFVRNLVFYSGRKTVDISTREDLEAFIASPTRVVCVLKAAELATLPPMLRARLRTLAEVQYFNPAAIRIKTLLRPDPDTDLDLVVLVSNQ